MIDYINLENILFLDIETVPQASEFNDIDEVTQSLWEKKAGYLAKNEESPEEIYEKAGIYAEFGKIVCISCGFVTRQAGVKHFRIKSFFGDDEKKLLSDFNNMLDRHFYQDDQYLCAHNGKEFDFPYIARRTLINGLKLPKMLNIAGKKPWEIKHLDTMELWKFGDYKHYTPLSLLTHIFGIPTPKDDIDGSDVAKVYWKDKDLERIVVYCQKDVLALAQLFMKYRGEDLIEESLVEISN
jgi:uncharacterized protein YprB with RNaseH-like and TPR domain